MGCNTPTLKFEVWLREGASVAEMFQKLTFLEHWIALSRDQLERDHAEHVDALAQSVDGPRAPNSAAGEPGGTPT
jgi:hypothetical protein